MNELNLKLKQYFGFEHFRGVQKEVIETLLKNQNALVIMRTGMGKSLCFQLPALLKEGLTVVISPLIALMKDQVDKLKDLGLNAEFVNSSLSKEAKESVYKRLAQKKIKILYVTPERFRNEEFIKSIKANEICLLAIDEAHCISEWGHDFRPDYTKLKEIRSLLGNPTTVAMTATATPEVQQDIIQQLGLTEANTVKYIEGVKRDNLTLMVQDLYGEQQKVQAIVMLLHKHPGSAIVYFSLIDTLKKISQELDKLNISHTVYHGQLPDGFRKQNQEAFLKGEVDLILATPAFGLGIDKPNIRQVIHGEIPGSIEAYYQEVGRAGRDGKEAFCTLLFDEDDVTIQMDFIKWSNPDPGFIKTLYYLIKDHSERIKTEGLDFLREKMNFYNRRDFRLETALNLLERWGSIERLQHKPNEIKVVAEPEGEYLNLEVYNKKLKGQNQKLLQLVQLTQYEGEELKQKVYHYFGVN